jgi:2-keto-4-pentenoate hydratase/2-oxohepta-3-ene-1,7-dioic acid hydratase in catechol pathway
LRIVRYRYLNSETYGILSQKVVLSLPGMASLFGKTLPLNFKDFVAEGKETVETMEYLMERVERKDVASVRVPLSKVDLLSPFAFPGKILCLGLNYFDHAEESNSAIPDEPIIFMKPRTAIIGPHQRIIKPRFVKELDYEGELGIVIGKKGKNIPESEAIDYVFGYTVFNDVSARNFQFKDGQWTRGQNGTTKNMVFNINQILYHLSRVMTLEPCDIIATGTPAGVGFAMKPPRYLGHGDVVRIEIEGIGVLENTVEERD